MAYAPSYSTTPYTDGYMPYPPPYPSPAENWSYPPPVDFMPPPTKAPKAKVGPWKPLALLLGLCTFLLIPGMIVGWVMYGVHYWDAAPAYATVSQTTRGPAGTNPCAGSAPSLPAVACFNSTTGAVANNVNEQAGATVTAGYQGSFNASGRVPITTPFWKNGLCPVNVHWHLGAEHLSAGQYDSSGSGPAKLAALASTTMGYQCHLYNSADSKFTKAYNWQYCVNMQVGQTYEVHWPHSALGACGTVNQYQYPFPDGVFCNIALLNTTYKQIGVQGQVYVVVNDESYYYPNLIDGMIVDSTSGYGSDMAIYTGSTTGQSVSNTQCSQYSPITWQVDRQCRLVSASSFDKMCADMLSQRDDMTGDLSPGGSRAVVANALAANNQVSANFAV